MPHSGRKQYYNFRTFIPRLTILCVAGGIHVVSSIPRNTNGKVLRRVLAEQFLNPDRIMEDFDKTRTETAATEARLAEDRAASTPLGKKGREWKILRKCTQNIIENVEFLIPQLRTRLKYLYILNCKHLRVNKNDPSNGDPLRKIPNYFFALVLAFNYKKKLYVLKFYDFIVLPMCSIL